MEPSTINKQEVAMHGSRKIFAAVSFSIFSVSAVVGIVAGLPMALKNAIDYGPQFLESPNTLWAIGAFIVWLVAMRWIWSGPDTSTSPLTNVRLSPIPKWILKASMQVKMIWLLFDEMSQFNGKVQKTNLTESDEQYVMQMLGFGYPSRIEDLLGKDILGRYLESLTAASESKNVKITCLAAVHVIGRAIAPILEREAAEVRDTEYSVRFFSELSKSLGLAMR